MDKGNSALATLTATYTDSEGEAENRSSDEEMSEPTKQSEESRSAQPSPRAGTSSNDSRSPHQRVAARRLVSYNDEEIEEAQMDDDDDDDGDGGSHAEDDKMGSEADGAATNDTNSVASLAANEYFKKYGFTLPPEPKGKCSEKLQEKIITHYEKMRTTGIDMNKIIQERKEFRNPSIYEKLIQFCDINELGTNYPAELYDPFRFGKESYYEELAKIQKIEMDKLEKTKKDTPNVVVVTGSKKVEDDKKRKSKWDQAAPTAIAPSTVVTTKTQTLTSSATGTKTTVISAFGSIAKKPKS